MADVDVVAGQPALVRTGGDELRREAALLVSLAGPGVPEVLSLHDEHGTVRLATALAPPLTPHAVDVRAAVARVAAVLARAHAAGVTHGPLEDDDLLAAPDGVVVSGWHRAGDGDPADDVAAVGRLIERLAGEDPDLLAVARRALAPDPPTMASLAAALVPAERVPVTARSLPWRRLGAGLAVAAGLVGIGFALTASGSESSSTSPGAAATPSTAAPPTTARPAPTTVPKVEVLVRGNEIEHGGRRWQVGAPGDVVVVADLDCDGQPSPVVLRPDTGQLWAFDGWSATGAPTTGRSFATVPGAVDLRVAAGERCDQLVVVDADGETATVG